MNIKFLSLKNKFSTWPQPHWWYLLLALAISVAFFSYMFTTYPFQERFEFDTDEGINAMKAFLVMRGYPLYDQVWSDQPPLFTYMLTTVFQLTAADIDFARITVLLLAALTLGASFLFLQYTWGWIHALAGVGIIFFLPYYPSLSVSVMIGLPAISFAVFACLLLIYWHRQRRLIWLILAALALAVSVMIKLFTGFLAPIFMLGLLAAESPHQNSSTTWQQRLTPTILWGTFFGGFALLTFTALVGFRNLDQLVISHLVTSQPGSGTSEISAYALLTHLQPSWPVFLMAGAGVIYILRTRNWLSLYPLAWVVVASTLLSFHKPVWYHHQLLITVPAAWLAAMSVGSAIQTLWETIKQKRILPFSLILALSVLGIFAYHVRAQYYNFTGLLDMPVHKIPPANTMSFTKERDFLKLIESNVDGDDWMITDRPMYAFRAGIPVPPSLAVISRKRMASGAISEQHIMDLIQEYQPNVILLGRYEYSVEMQAFIDASYNVIHTRGKTKLYLRADLENSHSAN